jgi:hypothetical protein
MRNVEHKIISRFDGLAARHGPRPYDLCVDKKFSQNRRISINRANGACGNIYSCEYCRRECAGDQKRLCALCQYCSRIDCGAFNISYVGDADRDDGERRDRNGIGKTRRGWSNADCIAPEFDMKKSALIPSPQSLIPALRVDGV